MTRSAPWLQVSFPPLESAILFVNAPTEVARLLERRWMASIGELARSAGERRGTATVRWRVGNSAGERANTEATVHWTSGPDGGSLSNASGRVRISPGDPESLVELEPAGVDDAAGLESLLEAALAHALVSRGECFLHAAAFELHGRRALVIGDSGSGKSTLSAAAVAAGGRVVSDDSLLLGIADGRPLLRSARRHLWLRPGSAGLRTPLHDSGFETEVAADGRIRLDRERSPSAFLDAHRPDCLLRLEPPPFKPGAADAHVVARLMSQAESLSALLQGTSALYVTDQRFAVRQRRLLDLLTRFAEELPAVTVSIGPSLLERPEECLAALADALP